MKNKIIIPTILFIIVLIFSFSVLWQAKDKNRPGAESPTDQIVLFYGDGCPHCEIVDKYINENKIEEKVSFVRKEVYNNEKNQKELIEKAKICGIANNNIGVPFLWEKGVCFVGDQDIIKFFELKINK
jgi:glutaredoxin